MTKQQPHRWQRLLAWGLAGVVLALAIIGGFTLDRTITRWYVRDESAVSAETAAEVATCWRFDGTLDGDQFSGLAQPIACVPASPTPSPPATPTASQTPSITPPPTNTPRPPATSTPTPSATATATEEPILTPTIDHTAEPRPTVTEPPPPTSTPEPVICTGIPATNWWIRDAPGGAGIGYFAPQDVPSDTLPGIAVQTFRLLARQQVNSSYWYAFWMFPGVVGWTHEGAWTLTGQCDLLPFEPPPQAVYQRAGPLTVMFHYAVGGNIDKIIEAGRVLASYNWPWGAVIVDDATACAKIMQAGGVCIARHAWANGQSQDCPDVALPPVDAARLYMPKQQQYYNTIVYLAGRGPDYYAIANECEFITSGAAWWSAFIVEAVHLAESYGWSPLIAPQFYAHQPPDRAYVRTLGPGLRALQRTGGGIGMHPYSVVTGSKLSELDAQLLQWGERYVTRDLWLRDWMLDELGFTIPIWQTEAAREVGNSPVDVDDFASYIRYANTQTHIAGVAMWGTCVGTMPPSACIDGRAVEIARAIDTP